MSKYNILVNPKTNQNVDYRGGSFADYSTQIIEPEMNFVEQCLCLKSLQFASLGLRVIRRKISKRRTK